MAARELRHVQRLRQVRRRPAVQKLAAPRRHSRPRSARSPNVPRAASPSASNRTLPPRNVRQVPGPAGSAADDPAPDPPTRPASPTAPSSPAPRQNVSHQRQIRQIVLDVQNLLRRRGRTLSTNGALPPPAPRSAGVPPPSSIENVHASSGWLPHPQRAPHRLHQRFRQRQPQPRPLPPRSPPPPSRSNGVNSRSSLSA